MAENKNDAQKEYDDAVIAGSILGYAGLAGLPTAFSMPASLLNDAKIAALEEQNPDLAPNNPYAADARNRFSTLGQILFGRGYPTDVQTPPISTRLGDYIFGRDIPHVNTGFFNAKGQFLNTGVAPFTSGGFETGGGGDSYNPSPGTTNFGGRESMVDETDRSGYA